MSRALVGAALACVVSGCGGSEKSGTPGPPSGGDVGDSMADSEPQAGGDGSSGWCGMQSPSHLLCEDFDEGVPGRLTSKTYGGATLAADVSAFVSGPESMWASVPALVGPRAAAGAFATDSFPMTGTHVQLRAEFQIAPDCTVNNDGVTLASVTFATYSVSLVAALGECDLRELAFGPDGGLASSASHPLASRIPSDTWTIVVLEVDLASQDARVTFAGGPTLDQALPLASSQGPAPPVTLGLGAEIQNQAGQSAGCQVRVDNVLFDSF